VVDEKERIRRKKAREEEAPATLDSFLKLNERGMILALLAILSLVIMHAHR
jgi:hypothetical protein